MYQQSSQYLDVLTRLTILTRVDKAHSILTRIYKAHSTCMYRQGLHVLTRVTFKKLRLTVLIHIDKVHSTYKYRQGLQYLRVSARLTALTCIDKAHSSYLHVSTRLEVLTHIFVCICWKATLTVN